MKPKGGNRKQPAGPHGFVRKTRKNNKEGLSSIKKRIRDLGRTLKKVPWQSQIEAIGSNEDRLREHPQLQ